jgi:hypothetical protein
VNSSKSNEKNKENRGTLFPFEPPLEKLKIVVWGAGGGGHIV